MRTKQINPYFYSITADEVYTPDADTLSVINNGDDDVKLTMNETSIVMKPGWDLSMDGGDDGCFKSPITIEFLGASKELLIIEGRKVSLIN